MSQPSGRATVRVGILHSLSGTMAIGETPLKDAALMAIEEIDRAGGVLGCSIEAIVEDGASDPQTFATKARKLIEQDGVAAVFGCWTSACRKFLVPIFEQLNSLLWYPVQYEGLECSENVFYTGACANQQVEPAVDWLLQNQCHRFYLLGSDYVFPRTVNKIIQAHLHQKGGTLVGKEYVPLGYQDFSQIIPRIKDSQPDVVFSTLNGDSNLAFYPQYYEAGLRADLLPILTVSISETELQYLNPEAITGHYAAWGYFQSVETPENQVFVQKFKEKYGRHRVTSDPVQAAYIQVYLWKKAVEKAGSFHTDAVRKSALGLTFAAPEGTVKIEQNHHLWQTIRIGKILPTKQFKIVWSCHRPIKPQPWLGIEASDSIAAKVAIELLSEVPQAIQYSCQLREQSDEIMATNFRLEETLAALKKVQRENQKTLEKLSIANQEIKKLNAILTSENLRLTSEVDVTRKLQQMLLPSSEELGQFKNFDIAGFMEPAEEVGGDYYDIIPQNGGFKIAIGDVTGHGLESGAIAIMIQTAIRTLLESGETDPKQFIDILNRTIYSNLQRMKSYKSVTLALIDYQDGEIRLSGQHEEAIVVRIGGKIERIDTVDLGIPIGLDDQIADFINSKSFRLNPGEGIVFYTDGITEAENREGRLYGIEQLGQVLSHNWQKNSRQICQAVLDDVRRHLGDRNADDDMALLVLKQKEIRSPAESGF